MKKIIIYIFILFFIFNFFYVIYADDRIENFNIKEIQETIETSSNPKSKPNINSRSAIVLDRNANAILYGKNENQKRPMASTTKIMTSIVIIENNDLNDIVTISKKAAGTGGSRLGLKFNDKISVKDLLYGLMLRSGNDAAVALAEYSGGSVQQFANLMNNKANSLGLKNTHFETPHGLDSSEHYTTTYELAILTDYALKNEIFSKIVNTQNINININGNSKNIHNTNELLGYLNGVYGVKTGFTNGAGRCLVTSVKRNDLDLICIVLGADTKKDRTRDSIELIEYAYANFRNINIKEKINEEFNKWKEINEKRIEVLKAKDLLTLKIDNHKFNKFPIKNGEEDKIKISIEIKEQLKAPIEKGEKVGTIIIKNNENIIEQLDIVTNQKIRKKNIFDYLKTIFNKGLVC